MRFSVHSSQVCCLDKQTELCHFMKPRRIYGVIPNGQIYLLFLKKLRLITIFETIFSIVFSGFTKKHLWDFIFVQNCPTVMGMSSKVKV